MSRDLRGSVDAVTMRRGVGIMVVAGVLFLVPAAAGASTTYHWEWDRMTDGSLGGDLAIWDVAGRFETVSTSFTPATNELTWTATFTESPDNAGLPNAFDLVLTDGPAPPDTPGNYAIYYFDATNPLDLGLSTYVYDSAVDSDVAWQTATQIESDVTTPAWDSGLSYDHNIITDIVTMSMTIDTTAIINFAGPAPWNGTGFMDHIGIWFHSYQLNGSAYDANGFITAWDVEHRGFYDGLLEEGFEVPAPPALMLFAVALGIPVHRRRR